MKKIESKHPAQLFIKRIEEDGEHYFEIQESAADCENGDIVGIYNLKEVKTVKKSTSTRLI